MVRELVLYRAAHTVAYCVDKRLRGLVERTRSTAVPKVEQMVGTGKPHSQGEQLDTPPRKPAQAQPVHD